MIDSSILHVHVTANARRLWNNYQARIEVTSSLLEMSAVRPNLNPHPTPFLVPLDA